MVMLIGKIASMAGKLGKIGGMVGKFGQFIKQFKGVMQQFKGIAEQLKKSFASMINGQGEVTNKEVRGLPGFNKNDNV